MIYGSPIIDPGSRTCRDFWSSTKVHRTYSSSGRRPASPTAGVLTGTTSLEQGCSKIVSARLAVPFMTRIISHNDEFRAASRAPSETIVRDICRCLYRRPGWRPWLSIELTGRQHHTRPSRLGNSVTASLQFQPDNTRSGLLSVPVRLGRCKAGKGQSEKSPWAHPPACRRLDVLLQTAVVARLTRCPLRVKRNGSAAVEELSDVADAHPSGALSSHPGAREGSPGSQV